MRADALEHRWCVIGRMLQGELKPRERILRDGLVQAGDADAQWSCHVASYFSTSAVALRHASRDERADLVAMRHDIRIIHARTDDVHAVTEFLHRQDVRPAPRRDDVELFSRRRDAVLLCAVCGDEIIAVAGCVQDGSVLHLAYFAVTLEHDSAARTLVQELEQHGRAVGAAVISAQTVAQSPTHRWLDRLGFETHWLEPDRDGERSVTVVDLVKQL